MNALKKLSILFLLLIPVWSLNAQDIITKKNAEEIKAKVVEVSKDEVKYKRYGSESGPTYTLPVSDIFMIKYENGDKDVFGNETSSDKPTTAAPSRPTPVQSQTATPSAAPERGNAALPEKARRGYVGIALGAASLLEDYSDVTSGGFQFNLVNFGYLFGKHVGMTASIMGISYVWDRYSDATVGFVGLTAGPLFTFGPDLKVVEFDVKPVLGVGLLTISAYNESVDTDESCLLFGLGVGVRWNFAKRFSLSGNLDYYNANFIDDLSSIGFTVGVNFRF